MGLIASIYRDDYDASVNAFYGKTKVTIVNIEGPFEPAEDRPAALLAHNAFGKPILVPANEQGKPVRGVMFGGTYAATSDSRFGRATGIYGAVPIHDRIEAA